MPRIALLSTSDTDLLSARASGADYLWANPARPAHTEMAAAIEGADIVVARILGGPQDLCSGFRRIAETGVPVIVLGGEQAPNAALMELSRAVPAGVVHEAHRYLAQGGPENLRQLHAFLSDTLLLTGEGFEPPAALPAWGVLERPDFDEAIRPAAAGTRPRVGVLFYRAQQAAGNTAYALALCDAIDAAGGVGVPIYATSLREAPTDLLDFLGTMDALVTTVLAAGGTRPADAQAGGDDGQTGWSLLRGCRRWMSRPKWPSRSSTAGSSRWRSRSRRPMPTACRITSPTPSAAPGWLVWPSTTRACATSRQRSARSRWSCRPIRPNTRGSGMPLAWTPRSR